MTDEHFGTTLRERLDDLADLGTPAGRPPLSTLDHLALDVSTGDPAGRRRSSKVMWWAVAAAVVLVVGSGLVVLDRSRGDDQGAVATDPGPVVTVVDGVPTVVADVPVGQEVTFTIETPDGPLEGWMQRTAGDDGRGTGFCAGVDAAGGCYGGTISYREPHLMAAGGVRTRGGLEERSATWLLPGDVDELVVTWDDGTEVVLPVAHPIDGLPGVTGSRIPVGVEGGTASGGGRAVPFTVGPGAPRDVARADELTTRPDPSEEVPVDGVHGGRLDQFFDDGTDAAIRIRPAELFGNEEAEAAAEADGQGPLGSPFYMREDVAPPLVLSVDPSQVRITVVDQSTLQPVEIPWEGYVAHLRGDDPFPIYWAGNVVEYTIEGGELVELDAIYLP